MEKILTLAYYSDEDEWGGVTSESIEGKTESGTQISYHVHDLWECPEDATINRDLFSGWEYVEALKLGMKIAQEGYTDIDYIEKKCDEEETF